MVRQFGVVPFCKITEKSIFRIIFYLQTFMFHIYFFRLLKILLFAFRKTATKKVQVSVYLMIFGALVAAR